MSGDRATADDGDMFELAPVSLWLEDYSAVRVLLEAWRREGVIDLAAHLRADPARVKACSAAIRVIKVNRRTLRLFEAEDLAGLTAGLDRIFRDDMFDTYVEELVQLWNGQPEFTSTTVNYSLGGRRIDIRLTGSILPGYRDSWARVLVAIEDVTDEETARRRAAASETHARGLFEHSPVSLWVEDFSAIRGLLDEIRGRGIEDLRVFTDVHPEFVGRCMSEIRVLDVNQQTLDLFGAPDKATLMHRLGEVFRDEMESHFREQLVDLWSGKLFQQREVVNYALSGEPIHALMQFSVLPGHESTWALAQVALTDITARKKAEAYLEFLGKHDVLTRLFNRSFYAEEMNRLDRKGLQPVSVVIVDVNGLKAINDEFGHAAGDALLRRAGEVLSEAVSEPSYAARIGGDEFAVLMPAVDERGAEFMIERLKKLVELNNQFYSGLELNLAIGAATSRPGERMEAVAKRADLRMYEAKHRYYADVGRDRRVAGGARG